MLILGETQATFGTLTPSQVVPGSSTVPVSSLAPIYWWRYMQWFLIAPATVAMLVGLLRAAEERTSRAEAALRGPWRSSRRLERVAVAAGQAMVCFGATAAMYGPGTGSSGRGVLFALGTLAGLIAIVAVAYALRCAAALTPSAAPLRWW